MPKLPDDSLPFKQTFEEQVFGCDCKRDEHVAAPFSPDNLSMHDLHILWCRLLRSQERKTSVVLKHGWRLTLSLEAPRSLADSLKNLKNS